jgi:protein HEXIM1/2
MTGGSEETEAVLQFADDEADQDASGGETENYSLTRGRSGSTSSTPCLKRSKRLIKRALSLKRKSWSSCGGSCSHSSCSARGRRWKPYYKRSFEERKKADANEVKRATRVREKLAATGQPLAPYNTTQFLMKDHELEYKDELNEELKALPPRSRTASVSAGVEDEESTGFYYSSPSDEEEFVNDDFVKQYGSFNTARLSEMSVADLILECTELNRRIEILEDQVTLIFSVGFVSSYFSSEFLIKVRKEFSLGQSVHFTQNLC